MRRIAVLVAALSFCVAGGQARATTQGSCDVAEARAVLNAYLVAFKRGQYTDLQALFATKPEFLWYAVSPPYGRTGQRAKDRLALLTYWRARHAKRETLNVVRFNFASTQERDGVLLANFNGRIIRKANDLPSERRGFKATLRCGADATQFIVLSIGTKV